MEKEYYYALEDNTRLFDGIVPVFYEISTEDVKHLALYMVSNFEPLSGCVSTMEGYIRALDYYSIENKDFPYSDVFNKLKYGIDSGFLITNIALALVEKDFRDNGVNEGNMTAYNKWQAQYSKQLLHSQQFHQIYSKSRTR